MKTKTCEICGLPLNLMLVRDDDGQEVARIQEVTK